MYDLKKIKVVLGFKSQGSLAVGPEQPSQQVGWFVCFLNIGLESSRSSFRLLVIFPVYTFVIGLSKDNIYNPF